ncbi:L-threonylcarbamoyladenylate synthase [Actinomyces bowdenii]|nr:L-threonylcarbamoyladenylate synthase [Actinomyces bowdenii]
MLAVSPPSEPIRPTASPAPDPRLLHTVEHLAQDGLVILPTDTVYGIGCAARSAHAVGRLLAAKGRGRSMPPPVLVSGPADLEAVVDELPEAARTLISTFWPGPLTLVLDAAPDLSWDLGETGGTIAVRMPDHPLTLQLLRAVGPLAVTSANRTGAPPATSAAEARAAFSGRVRSAGSPDPQSPQDAEACGAQASPCRDILLLDGGSTPGPLPSTIVDLSGPHAQAPVVLREGVLDARLVQEIAAAPPSAPSASGTPIPPEATAAPSAADTPLRTEGAIE